MSTELHRLLQRQLRKCAYGTEELSSEEQLEKLLPLVHRVYVDADQDRYTLERSLDLSSKEMATLNSQLEEDRNRLRNILESMREGVVSADASGRIEYCNPRLLELLGCSAEELEGAQLVETLFESGSDGETNLRPLVAGLRDADHFQLDGVEVKRQGAKPFPATVKVKVLHAADAVVGFVILIEDLTEAQQAKLEIDRARIQAEAAERATAAKAEFLANMSHEIRTPMTAILGYVDLLADASLDRETFEEYHGIIQRNGQHLLAIVNDILDLSKAEAGGVEIEEVEVDVRALVQDVSDLARQRADEKQLALEVIAEGKLPAKIESDPTRLKQILINLVGNAIKFTETGSVVIRVVGDESESELRIRVEDTGVGMNEDQQARIFEAFSQAEASTSRRFGGTGLGLAISRQLARLLGGDIRVTSALNVGSQFEVCLPIAESVEWEDAQAMFGAPEQAPAPPTPATESRSYDLRVLVVDDTRDNRVLLSRILSKVGCTVSTAENGQQAIDLVLGRSTNERPTFDLILMDMFMPVKDGYTASAELRTEGYEGTIVALTANASDVDRQRCLEAGCDNHLSKPISKSRLMAQLESVLSA